MPPPPPASGEGREALAPQASPGPGQPALSLPAVGVPAVGVGPGGEVAAAAATETGAGDGATAGAPPAAASGARGGGIRCREGGFPPCCGGPGGGGSSWAAGACGNQHPAAAGSQPFASCWRAGGGGGPQAEGSARPAGGGQPLARCGGGAGSSHGPYAGCGAAPPMEQPCPAAGGDGRAGAGVETLTFWSGCGCPPGTADPAPPFRFRPGFPGGAPLAFRVSTRILHPSRDPCTDPPSAGSALSSRNSAINLDLKRPLIRVSWRSIMSGLDAWVSQRDINCCRFSFAPEINPRMSGDPSALAEKLRIDASLR